ncbi:DUF4136 domain-containing protein [Pseudomonas sp. Marseille-QA0892]
MNLSKRTMVPKHSAPAKGPWRLLLTAGIAALVSACQSSNPYTAQSVPMPPPPAGADTHFDASAYPAAPTDYSRYQSWRWGNTPSSSGALNDNVRDAVANGLEQRGLRPAATDKADLTVDASIRTERRLQQVQDSYGSYGGYYGGSPYRHGYDPHGYGVGASIPITRTYEVEVGVLRVSFRDAAGQAVWSGSTELSVRGDQRERREAVYEAARKLLANYPPR